MNASRADTRFRAQLDALYESIWPGVAANFEEADWLGWPVGEVSTPFVEWADERLASHVGVLDIPVRLAGQDRVIAGIHGVCTRPELRRQGHYRRAMERAMAHVSRHYSAAKLCTDQPWLYTPLGFRAVPQHRFRLRRSGPGGERSRAGTLTARSVSFAARRARQVCPALPRADSWPRARRGAGVGTSNSRAPTISTPQAHASIPAPSRLSPW